MNLKHSQGQKLKGWLFDVYPCLEGMALWIITEEGQRVRLIDPFHPSFYFAGPRQELSKIFLLLSREKTHITVTQVERIEFFSGKPMPVMQVTVQDPTQYQRLVNKVIRSSDQLSLYNCDISLPQLYFYERGVFPLAFCLISHTASGEIRSITPLDSPWDMDYQYPSFRFLHLKLEGALINPNHGWRGKLEISDEDHQYVLEADDPRELISHLNSHIHKQDPDIIFTDWGDSFLIPQLNRIAQELCIPLAFNRDATMSIAERKSRSYASYGRIVYSAGAQTFFGRWHIDRQNSFILNEAALDGLLEQARVTKLPIQHMARTSTGTGITSMQLETAYKDGILIPWRKSEPEEFKSALDLLTIDKGGMVFLPPVGFYEEVGELDFASMYPAIMERFNVSPETVGCNCCPNNRVPETGYTVCTKRRGLVPRTLEPLLAKRARYKERLKAENDPRKKESLDRRQNALKWLLVVSFGYLGYKNARFGRIEAHECVTAYSREKLLCAKEIAEAQGFQLLHAIVDSIWVKKPGATEQDYQGLAQAITQGTGLPIALEGIYRWIGFLPSKTHPSLAVPNRYMGVFHSGKIKIRGLEVRRSDAPPFVKQAQECMIEVLRKAKNLKEYEYNIPEAIAILTEHRLRLEEGRVPLCDLVITRNLSQDPQHYEKATLSAVVAQELVARGIRLDPGESIQYIITHNKDKDPASRARAYATITADHSYDIEKYTELLLKAGESLLSCFGYGFKKLEQLTRLDAHNEGATQKLYGRSVRRRTV